MCRKAFLRTIPPMYRGCDFCGYRPTSEAQTAALKALMQTPTSDSRPILIFSKGSGTGKSHLAAAYAKRCADEVSVRWVSAPDIFLSIKRAFSDNTAESVIDSYHDPDVLVVDDFGAESVTDWAKSIWYMIVDKRYSWLKKTVYTTNLEPADIDRVFGGRIVSRMTSGIVLRLDGKDMRHAN